MIGDLIIKIKTYIKQAFCIHDYNIITRDIGNQSFNISTCKKCGRIYIKEI